jgi:uncharacterized membrane protein
MEQQGQNQAPTPSTQNQPPVQETATQKRDNLLVFGTYVLFFLPLVVVRIKNDPFFRFHMKQSLGLLISWVAADVLYSIVHGIGGLLQLFVMVVWVIALINALKGKQEPAPILGKYFEKINL